MSARTTTPTGVPRNLALSVRMVLVSVLTPVVAIGLLMLVLLVLPTRAYGVGVMIALAIGIAASIHQYQEHRGSRVGRELTERGDAELLAIVDRLCAIADIARPEVRLVDQRQPNSWVVQYPRTEPRLYLTSALLRLLSTDELTAVIGHELSHIANHDALVMTVVGMPSAIMRRSRAGGFGAVFVMLIGAVTELGTIMLSRYRELAADAGSAAITGRPSALASALMKVSDALTRVPSTDLREAAALNSFNLVAVAPRGRRHRNRVTARVLATHPPLQSRLDALHAFECGQQRTGHA